MSDETTRIVIAPRLAALSAVPGDWQSQVAAIPGVTVLGDAFGKMQVRATEEALREARGRLGHLLHFEPVAERRPAG